MSDKMQPGGNAKKNGVTVDVDGVACTIPNTVKINVHADGQSAILKGRGSNEMSVITQGLEANSFIDKESEQLMMRAKEGIATFFAGPIMGYSEYQVNTPAAIAAHGRVMKGLGIICEGGKIPVLTMDDVAEAVATRQGAKKLGQETIPPR